MRTFRFISSIVFFLTIFTAGAKTGSFDITVTNRQSMIRESGRKRDLEEILPPAVQEYSKRERTDENVKEEQEVVVEEEEEEVVTISPTSTFPSMILANAAFSELKKPSTSTPDGGSFAKQDSFDDVTRSKLEDDAENDDDSSSSSSELYDSESESEYSEDEMFVDYSSDQWKSSFIAVMQADDYDRLLDLGKTNSNRAHFKIYSPSGRQDIFTYPLQFAIKHNLNNAYKALIDYMIVNYDAVDSFGNTALSLALKLDKFDKFSELAKNTKNLHLRDANGLFLTHIAASSSTLSTLFLENLKSLGFTFCEICSVRKWTPLVYAVVSGNLVLAKWINDNSLCNAADQTNQLILFHAVQKKDEVMALELMKWGAPIFAKNANNQNIFHLLARKNFPKLMNLIKENYQEYLDILLRQQDTIKGFYPIHHAAERDNLSFIVNFAPSINIKVKSESGKLPIEIAFDSGSHEVFKVLFTATESNDFRKIFGETSKLALKSYRAKNFKLTQLLLELFGADSIYSIDELGRNLLHHAIIAKDVAFLDWLMEQYAFDPIFTANRIEDPQANCPFSWAVYRQEAEIVVIFLKNIDKLPIKQIRLSLFFPETADLRLRASLGEVDLDFLDLSALISVYGGKAVEKIIESKFQK